MSLTKRVDGASQPLLAVFGEVDAGEDADRRADAASPAPTISSAADDRVGEAAVVARRRRHLREERRARSAADALAAAASPRIQTSQNRPNAMRQRATARASTRVACARRARGRPGCAGVAMAHVVAPFALARSRSSSSLDSASTTKVIRNRIRPSSISDDVVAGRRPPRRTRWRAPRRCCCRARTATRVELVRVADDEGDRHGLAERAAQAEHDAADHADLGVGQHDVATPLPRWWSPAP